MDNNPKITFGAGLQKTTVTLPSEQLCHYITDTELEIVSDLQQGHIANICVASAGAFFGSVVPAVDGLSRFGVKDHPMTPTDLVSFSICLVTLAIFIVTAMLWRGKHGGRITLLKSIRERQKVTVHVHEEE